MRFAPFRKTGYADGALDRRTILKTGVAVLEGLAIVIVILVLIRCGTQVPGCW